MFLDLVNHPLLVFLLPLGPLFPGSETQRKGSQTREQNVHHLPVDSAGTLIRLDVNLIVVNVDLRNIHLKVIGQKLDWFSHSANARPARCLEHLLQRGQVGARSY